MGGSLVADAAGDGGNSSRNATAARVNCSATRRERAASERRIWRDVDHRQQNREAVMDKDRVKGAAREAKGAVKEKVGQVTGDTKIEVEGKTEKTAGKVQNTVGGMKDAVRGND
jgi:uncharacterized protein YjbJ (UPF0337 family)